MHPYWKQESELAQLAENHRALSASDYSLGFDEDMAQLDQLIHGLQTTKKRVSHNLEHCQRLGKLLDFVQLYHKDFSTQTSEQSFERIQVLRQWLVWLPTSMLRGGESGPSALAVLAQFFAAGVALDRFYPEMGGAYLGAISIGPIEEIHRILATHSASDPFNAELRLALGLMDLPRHIVERYRSLLVWSPRPSIEHYSGSPTPRHGILDCPLASSSSPASDSPSYAAYTPPLQSPPAITAAGSSYPLADGYVTAAPSHSLYPPSPQLLDTHDTHLGLSDLNHTGTIPHSSPYTPPYGDDVLCAGMPRANGTLGLNVDVYPQTHSFEMPGVAAPEPCWS